MLDRIYRTGTATLSGTIHARLDAAGAEAIARDDDVPHDVRARALAGAIFALLRDWIDSGRRHTPERMDQVFHALAYGPAPVLRTT